MGVLGQMTVSIGIDLSNLTSGIAQAKSEMSSLSSVSTSSGGGILSGFQNAASGALDFGAKVGQTYIGVKGFYDMVVGGASALLAPAATAETTTLSFETLLHSTSAAKQEMQDLNTYAAGTPMQTQWVDNAASKILAFGGTVGDVKPEITAIGDSLSGLGKLSEASLNSIVDIFGKISAQGKITGGDMMQLSTWGIPAWQALSTAMHKPIPELQQMVSAGLVPANVAIKALETGMESTFGGGMAKQANTFTGLMSTLASNWQIAMAAIGGPALKLAESGLSNMGTILASPAFASFATGVGQNIANVLTTIGTVVKTTVGPAFKLFMDDFVNEEPIGIFVGIFQNLGSIFMSLLSILQSLSPGFALFVGLFKSVDAKSGLVAAVNDFISAVYVVNAITGDAANLIGSFATWLQKGGLPAEAFKDALIGIGVAMAVIQGIAIVSVIADFISILPIVIGLTWFWVAGLTAAAVEMVIATWPIIAIGAAIALVVAIIILAVQHWGDIVAWLKGAWASTVSFFQAMWAGIVAIFAGIGKWFADRWNEAVAGIMLAWSKVTAFFGGIGNWFHDRFTQASDGVISGWGKVTGFFGGIGNWFHSKGQDASNGLQSGWSNAVQAAQVMAKGVVDAGKWLYDHNYYVKDAVDATKAANVWLVDAWNTSVKAVVAAWTWLSNGAVSIWNTGTTAIHDAAMAAWNFLVSVWTTATSWLSARWSWVSQQAQAIWSAIVFVVSGAIQVAVQFITQKWTDITTWLSAKWTWVSAQATAIWTTIYTAISTKITQVTTWIASEWAKATLWLQQQWDKIAFYASTAWAAVSAVFGSIWSKYISGPLGGLWTSITTWFTNFGNQALTSGQNFVQMLANGITSGTGWIWNAVVGIANTIWTALGFHSPPAGGPLADSDEYMPNFVNMLSRGLNAGIPKMQAASFAMAQPLAVLSPASSAAVSVASTAGSATTSASSASHTFILEVDGRQFTNQVVGPNLDKVVRLKLGAKGRLA